MGWYPDIGVHGEQGLGGRGGTLTLKPLYKPSHVHRPRDWQAGDQTDLIL